MLPLYTVWLGTGDGAALDSTLRTLQWMAPLHFAELELRCLLAGALESICLCPIGVAVSFEPQRNEQLNE